MSWPVLVREGGIRTYTELALALLKQWVLLLVRVTLRRVRRRSRLLTSRLGCLRLQIIETSQHHAMHTPSSEL